nr:MULTISPECIES: GTPase-associated protein 1-related protein [unclassified Streptomyces]
MLAAPGRAGWLRVVTRECVETTLRLDTALREADEATALARAFLIPQIQAWSAPRALKRHKLVPALLKVPADPARLRTDLDAFDFSLADRYLRALHSAVLASVTVDDVLLSHVTGVVSVSLERNRLPRAHLDLIETLHLHTAHHWRSEDLARLARALRPYNTRVADLYEQYAEDRLGLVKKWGRKLTLRRPSDEPRPEGG